MTDAEAKTDEFETAETSSPVDKLVLATVNAPYKREICVSILQECLLTGETGDWTAHVASFFTDVSPKLILGFATLHGISKFKLAQAYLAMKAKTGERNPDLEAALVPLATVA
jgi:hypothetical protein